MNTPALVPEVLQAAIPDDTSLATQCPVWLDFAAIEAELKDVDGKALANQGACGSSQMQELIAYDTKLKGFLKDFPGWYETTDMAALERWGQRAADRRLEITKRAGLGRSLIAIIHSNYETEAERLTKAQQLKEEAEQRQEAERERQAELEALRAQATPETEAQAAMVQAQPLTPTSVPLTAARQSGGIAGKVVGTSTTPVAWRKVKQPLGPALQALFTYLGSAEGKALVSACVRVKSVDRASDEITISFAKLNADVSSEYPGLSNNPGRISSNRGK